MNAAALQIPEEAHVIVPDPWVTLNQRIEAMSARFEVHIGYTKTDAAYEQAVERLLEAALNHGKMIWNGEANSIVVEDPTWESGTVCLSVDPGRAERLGMFGSYGGRRGGLVIRNGPHAHSVWVLKKVDWGLVIRLANGLIRNGRLSRDNAFKLFVYMIPRNAPVVS
jgi:hypothetical protein